MLCSVSFLILVTSKSQVYILLQLVLRPAAMYAPTHKLCSPRQLPVTGQERSAHRRKLNKKLNPNTFLAGRKRKHNAMENMKQKYPKIMIGETGGSWPRAQTATACRTRCMMWHNLHFQLSILLLVLTGLSTISWKAKTREKMRCVLPWTETIFVVYLRRWS